MKNITQNIIFATIILFGLLSFSNTVFASTVTKTLYAWAHDLAGNISTYLTDSVDITITNGKTYYVSPNGNDSNNGLSPSQAWQTLTPVMNNTFLPGDSILFERGGYWNGTNEAYFLINDSGTSGLPITYSSYGSGAKPIIDRRADIKSYVATHGGWLNQGNNIWKGFYDGRPDRIWIDNVDQRKRQNASGFIANDYYWASDYLYIYSTSDPNIAYTSIVGIFGSISATVLDNVDYITLTNIDFRGGTAIEIKGSRNIIVENSDIGYNSTQGIWAYAKAGVTTYNDNVIIRNNIFNSNNHIFNDWFTTDQPTYEGLSIYYGCHNWEVYGNTFINWSHAGVSIQNLDNNYTISNISVHDNDISAPDIDYGRTFLYNGLAGTVSNNKVYNNKFHDFSIIIQLVGDNLEFHNNLIYNSFESSRPGIDGGGVAIGGQPGGFTAHNVKFYNNIIANTVNIGLVFWYGSHTEPFSQNNFVINNIIYNCGLNHPFNTNFWASADYMSNDNNTFKNNLIYRNGITDLVYFGSEYSYMDITELNNLNGVHGWIITNNIQNSPLFVDPNNGDFHLQSNSPAINTGIDVGLPFIGSNPDIGAFETNN